MNGITRPAVYLKRWREKVYTHSAASSPLFAWSTGVIGILRDLRKICGLGVVLMIQTARRTDWHGWFVTLRIWPTKRTRSGKDVIRRKGLKSELAGYLHK